MPLTTADLDVVIDKPDEDPSTRRAQVTWADQIRMRPVRWAWTYDGQGRLPASSLAVAAGREGTGKSTAGIWLTAQITRGTLPGEFYGTPRAVLYVAVEDSWEHTIAPRLRAAGADLSLVGRFEVVIDDDEQVTLCLPYDNKLLEDKIVEHQVALVVLDPLASLLSERLDSHRSRDVRRALDPLARMADRTGAVLLGIAHFNKGNGTDPSSLITGSGAFKDVPRAVFGFVRDPDDEDGARVMTQTKNSLGRDELASLRYTIEDAVVDTDEGPAHVGRLVWHGESERTAQDILRDGGSPEEDRDERRDAAAWLRDYLTDPGRGGEAEPTAVQQAGKAAGFSPDVLKRAKHKAGVRSRKTALNGPWVWTVDPRRERKGAQACRDQKPAPFAPFAPFGGIEGGIEGSEGSEGSADMETARFGSLPLPSAPAAPDPAAVSAVSAQPVPAPHIADSADIAVPPHPPRRPDPAPPPPARYGDEPACAHCSCVVAGVHFRHCPEWAG